MYADLHKLSILNLTKMTLWFGILNIISDSKARFLPYIDWHSVMESGNYAYRLLRSQMTGKKIQRRLNAWNSLVTIGNYILCGL